ncbi:hypothetical protein SISNIDRAFT_487667 [Sistotremastrum niveocremeum HHB9708]|uniref:CBM1 domain-containing protein n=1 Tax=Sistotremastrum niveocremeum HHB9708 TaxID=1314777 RepID=A0A164SCN6_9AGAM|nr:hypothetical protein SISNIDRAFT_487667 [Sistotremastrum niveocremeum HHB9708]
MLSSSRTCSVMILGLMIFESVVADDTPTPTITSPPTISSTHSASTANESGYGIQSHWGQCGGLGYQGFDICTSTYKCREVIPTYYSQIWFTRLQCL